jgi:hypothetical protein
MLVNCTKFNIQHGSDYYAQAETEASVFTELKTTNLDINTSTTNVINLPDEQEGVYYIVDKYVKYRLTHIRTDLIIPHSFNYDKENNLLTVQTFII